MEVVKVPGSHNELLLLGSFNGLQGKLAENLLFMNEEHETLMNIVNDGVMLLNV